MYGVSKISIEPSLMMISVQDVEFKGNSLARYLQIFADTGVVVDMISQSAPHGTTMDFSFTASSSDLPLVMKAISAANLDKDAKAAPLISVGYSKLNLFGEEMVTSCGVAARALNALAMAGIEVLLITTSDLDISLLVRAENEDAAYEALKKAYELKYSLEVYQEHALERSSSSKAIAYVGIKKPDGTMAWGAGVDPDIIRASIDALVTAINNLSLIHI